MATVPVEHTWVTGEIATAALLNSNVRDALNFLMLVPRCSITRGTSTGWAPGWPPTVVTFDTLLVNNDGMAPATGGFTKMTAQTPGLFSFEFTAVWLYSATAGTNGLGINLNGAGVWGAGGGQLVVDTRTRSGYSNLGTSMSCEVEQYMNVGDYVEFFLVTDANGGTVNSTSFNINAIGYWSAAS